MSPRKALALIRGLPATFGKIPDGSTTQALACVNGSGMLLYKFVTTTSTDGKTVTIDRDPTGAGYTAQQEVYATNANGSRSITKSDLTARSSTRRCRLSLILKYGLEASAMNAGAGNPIKQGQLLRKALKEHVRLAKKTGQFTTVGFDHFIDIEEITKRYVPAGSTFEYAESVLRGAGFTMEARPTPDAPGRFIGENAYSVNAFLGYGRNKFEGVQCVVALLPAQPYDYHLVHSVQPICGFIKYI